MSPHWITEQASDRVGAERARHGAGGRVAAAARRRIENDP